MTFLLIENSTVQDNREKSEKDFIRQSLELIIVSEQHSSLSDFTHKEYSIFSELLSKDVIHE